MKRFRFSFTRMLYVHSLYAVLIIATATMLFRLIARDTLTEAVVASLYFLPIVWITARWGQGPGLAAVLSATLLFDFNFIAPFYTFAIGTLEGGVILGTFVVVGGLVVWLIQAILTRAQASELEAALMYELSTILAETPSQDAIAKDVARFLRRHYKASLVTVSFQPEGQLVETAAYEPHDGILSGKPDRRLSLLNAWELVGEIQIWHGDLELPPEDSRILQNIATQVEHVLGRCHPTQPAQPAEKKNGHAKATSKLKEAPEVLMQRK